MNRIQGTKRSNREAVLVFNHLIRTNPLFVIESDNFKKTVEVSEAANGYFAGCMVYTMNGRGFSFAYESNDGYTHHTRNDYATRKFPGYEYTIQ